MDKNFEDKIAKMAFGELSEVEAKEVRAHAETNVDAARALSEYEAMKSDLRRMRDVPPDQLSKERLQNAILTQGLRPKPVRGAFPWAWATSAAVMGALALVMFVRLPREATRVPVAMEYVPHESVITPEDSLSPDDRQLINQTIAGFGSSLGTSTNETVRSISAPETPIADNIVPAVRNWPVKSAWKSSRVRNDSRSYRSLSTRGMVRIEPSEIKPEITAAADSTLAAKKEPETLVLIKSDKDNHTGASNAVEVHQTQDVIVSS